MGQEIEFNVINNKQYMIYVCNENPQVQILDLKIIESTDDCSEPQSIIIDTDRLILAYPEIADGQRKNCLENYEYINQYSLNVPENVDIKITSDLNILISNSCANDCIDYTKKEEFNWISLIRLPDFVTKVDFDWAVEQAEKKKKTDFSKVEFLTYDEGLCVQCMHIGSYDSEPETVERMHEFMINSGYVLDINDKRFHHEIYLSDARKTAPEKLKTVIRHPVKS